MFTGIDEVDWASMKHAYGSAAGVPELLRGLASPSIEERERALDGMYGAVHHQGDVYDSTLACIPFLFTLVACPELPDRSGIVELLVSIGGADVEDDLHDDESDIDFDDAVTDAGAGADGTNSVLRNYAMARTAVRMGAAVFVELAEDQDPEVRRAVPVALVRFLDEPARVLELLSTRLAEEQEGSVRLALAGALGLFAKLHAEASAPAVERLVTLTAAPNDPGLRLAALGQLADCAPDRLPSDLVPAVIALLSARSRQPRFPDSPERPDTGTPIGRLRHLAPADEEGSQLLRTLHSALGGRTSDRIALLKGQLSSADPVDRCNAVWMSAGLFREWRAAYDEPVALIGEQLSTREERLRDAAVSVLEDLFTLAAPAADRLAALVENRPESWVRHWERGAPTLGGPLKALSRTGDLRAAPALSQVLAQATLPNDIGYAIGYLGPAAAPLAPLLRERLGEIPLDSPETYDRAASLLSALGGLRHAAAVPEVLRLLRGTPGEPRRRDWLVEAATRTLGQFGPAAREVIPVLRGLLDSGYGVTAATALWSVEGDAEAVLPLLRRELTAAAPGRPQKAAEALARLGPLADSALPGLCRLLDSGEAWERTAAACALWDIAGDPGPVLAVFRSVWRENAHTRGTITACLARMGPEAAPAHDLLRAELAAPRRHRARSGGYSSHDILEDERLLRGCREVLNAA